MTITYALFAELFLVDRGCRKTLHHRHKQTLPACGMTSGFRSGSWGDTSSENIALIVSTVCVMNFFYHLKGLSTPMF